MPFVELPPLGTVIDGRYELLSHLGTGGFGAVYSARQLNTGQLVAIKVARHHGGGADNPSLAAAVARFRREMAVVAQLSHPNIVRLIDAGQLPEGPLFAVLQLVQGMSLAELLYREGPMEPEEAKHLLLQVLDALCSAHDLGVIHRDLKPANIMVTHVGARRNAMVLDFGIATFVKAVRDEGYQSLTPDGTVGGTPAYMSPEQLHGQSPNPQTDVYAWGLVLLECLTGVRAVRGSTVAEEMFLHLRPEPHAMPAEIAAHALGQVLRKALAKDPALRYGDARDALAELSRCDVSDLSRQARPAPGAGGSNTNLVSTADPFAVTDNRVTLGSADAITVSDPWSARVARSEGTLGDTRGEADQRPAKPPWGGFSSTHSVVAERRQITSMACELTPPAALSAHLEPDALYDRLSRFRRMVEGTIAPLEGAVQQVEGCRVVCHFGFPVAHEDDASRAVQSALEIRRLVQESDWGLPPGVDALDLHAGVHAGMVVTSSGALGSDEFSIVGDVSRLAMRLEEDAEPGEILISEAVQRLVDERFDSEPAGRRRLGGQQPQPVYRVVGAAEVISRIDAGGAATIGRDSELATLADRWDEVCEGRGQVVLVSGEIGIGKSHLARVFRRRIDDSGYLWLDCRSSPYLSATAFHPIIRAFERLFWIQRDAPPAVGRRRIREGLEGYRVRLDRIDELLFALLGLDEHRLPVRELFRQGVEERLLDLCFALAEYAPLLLRFEDIQWADPSTRALLALLVDQAPLAPVLILATTRPEYQPEWQARSHVTRIQLARLSRRWIEAMVRFTAGVKEMPDELVDHLTAKADGVPLFVEELTRAVLESPAVIERGACFELAGALGSLAIPDSLRGSLMARLDRLGPVKEVAQIASVIGREFDFALLSAICEVEADELERGLALLVDAELIIQRGRRPQARYVFKHGLTQDIAYESLLEQTRRQYHARIAEALSRHFAERAAGRPELVAHHFTEAGREDAVDWWLRAGTRAAERSANAESIQHLRRGLELLAEAPLSPERQRRELSFLMRMGPPLLALAGYGADEVEAHFSRALTLCRELGVEAAGARSLVPALWGLWLFYQVRARYEPALEMGSKLLEIAESGGAPELYLYAHQALGASYLLTGDFARAREQFEAGMAVYDPERHRDLAILYAQDPGVFCTVYLARIDCAEGRPDRARAGAIASIERARAGGHPHSVVFALCMTLPVFLTCGDMARVEAMAAEAEDVSREYRLVHWLAFSRFMRGMARAGVWQRAWRQEQADASEAGGSQEPATELPSTRLASGVQLMRSALEEWREAGGRASLPYLHAILAEHLGRAGQLADAFAVLEAVPATNYDGGEYLYESTWRRVRAHLLLLRDHPGDRAAAGAEFEQAAAGARSRGDLMEELATLVGALSWAPVRAGQGKHGPPSDNEAEVQRRLGQLLDALAEGRDLPLVRAAERLRR
ncbi:protein kinase domain-containing protein [Haliangium sp.]|uniref:protein kinase domain-containing protein n=1 Tax=Haliangium sp. TaxID=2663208 RepID=UPI003D0A92C5